jgi:hypothetical protein
MGAAAKACGVGIKLLPVGRLRKPGMENCLKRVEESLQNNIFNTFFYGYIQKAICFSYCVYASRLVKEKKLFLKNFCPTIANFKTAFYICSHNHTLPPYPID